MPFLEIFSVADVYSDKDLRPISFLGCEYDLKPGVILDLGGIEIRAGRSFENNLVIPLRNVSRFHFRLYRKDDCYVYQDVGSRQVPLFNGTYFWFGGSRTLVEWDTFNAAGVMFRYFETFPEIRDTQQLSRPPTG